MLQNAGPLRKSAPWPLNISDEHVSCTAPATRHASFHILFKCLQNPHVLLTFDKVHNPLRLPSKTASEHPKVPRTPQFFTLLTSKCASRRNGVHFFEISTSKSALNPSVFYTFDFKMCFAPQRRALFRHHNFLKVVRTCGVLYILTWKCVSRHNGVQFFISHLASWLRTCRFSELTFRPSGATNHWKNTVGSLTSKLPSITVHFSSLISHLSFHFIHFVSSYLITFISSYSSSTAQGGGGSFKDRKRIGEIGCCESRMAERIHWWTERWLENVL